MEQSPVKLTSFQNLATEKESEKPPQGRAHRGGREAAPRPRGPDAEGGVSFEVLGLGFGKNAASRQVNSFAKGSFLSRVGG